MNSPSAFSLSSRSSTDVVSHHWSDLLLVTLAQPLCRTYPHAALNESINAWVQLHQHTTAALLDKLFSHAREFCSDIVSAEVLIRMLNTVLKHDASASADVLRPVGLFCLRLLKETSFLRDQNRSNAIEMMCALKIAHSVLSGPSGQHILELSDFPRPKSLWEEILHPLLGCLLKESRDNHDYSVLEEPEIHDETKKGTEKDLMEEQDRNGAISRREEMMRMLCNITVVSIDAENRYNVCVCVCVCV